MSIWIIILAYMASIALVVAALHSRSELLGWLIMGLAAGLFLLFLLFI